MPISFPQVIADGFELNGAEASWLRERMVQADPQSLLAYLLYERPSATQLPSQFDCFGTVSD